MAEGWGGRCHLTLNPGHPIGHPSLTPTTHATTVSQLLLLAGVRNLSCTATALPNILDACTSCLNPPFSPEESATRWCTVQRPGWGQLRWEFTVSERTVHQTWGTWWCFHGASPSDLGRARRFQLLEEGTEKCPARDGGWSGGRCLPELIQSSVSHTLMRQWLPTIV